MADENITFPQWREETAQISYPFSDTALLTNGIVTLPKGTFLDGRLYPIGSAPRLFLNRITLDVTTMTLAVRSEGTDELATASFDITTPPANGELKFEDAFGRPAGMLLASDEGLATLSSFEQGTFEFLVEHMEFAAAVVVAMPDAGLRGFLTDDGELVAGDVWLVGENGVVLRAEDGDIRVDIVGDPFALRSLCEAEDPPDDQETSEAILDAYCPIETINELPPDETGNYALLPGSNQSLSNILRIEPGPGASLKIDALGSRRFRGAN